MVGGGGACSSPTSHGSRRGAQPNSRGLRGRYAFRKILAAALIWCSACPVLVSAPHSRSSSACRNLDGSAARKPQLSPDLLPSITTAGHTKASAASPADARGCAARSSPPPCQPPSAGTKPWSCSTPVSLDEEKPTTPPSSHARASS